MRYLKRGGGGNKIYFYTMIALQGMNDNVHLVPIHHCLLLYTQNDWPGSRILSVSSRHDFYTNDRMPFDYKYACIPVVQHYSPSHSNSTFTKDFTLVDQFPQRLTYTSTSILHTHSYTHQTENTPNTHAHIKVYDFPHFCFSFVSDLNPPNKNAMQK